MASKTVQPIDIKLGIKGGEQLGKLSSAFRDLGKTVGQTDAGLEEARKSIIEYGKSANQSEALIRGQIKAFEGLQKQAQLGGKVFTQLENDIKALGGVLYGASAAVEAKRKSLVDLGSSANATTTQIQSAIKALTVLRSETRLDSEAFNAFGQSIDRLAERFEKAKQEAQDFANAQARSGRLISASSGAAKQQIKDLDLVTQALREQREELGRLEGEARIRRGVADLAERGAVSSSRRSYQEALAESVLSGTAEEVAGTGASLKKLLSTKDIRAALAEVELQIAELQKQVESKLSRGMQISFQEIARSARESARAMAAAFADPEFLNVLSKLDERIGTLPNTTAGYSQRLRELEQQLANTDRSSENYRRVSEEISKVQKELAKDVYGYSEALEQLAVSQENAARRAEKLRGIGEYVASVSGLGATAAAGRAGTPMVGAIGGYRDPATGAMIATGRGMRRDRMAYQESQELERVASAQGDLQQVFEGAIETYRSSLQTIQDLEAKRHEEFMSQVEAEDAAQKKAFQEQQSREEREYQRRVAIGRQMRTGEFASRRLIGMPNQELSQLYGGIVRIGQADQMRQLEMMGREYDEVAKDIRKVTAASNGSVSSLNAQRSAWSGLRDILDPASQQFKEVTREIERVDKALEKTQRRRRRMSPMQMTQAAGAAISGGIFGGPEGFLGGAIGAIGGVGGAFAGAAIGAQVGGLRRQLGEFADYAAQIQKMQIALRGVAGSQDEFNRAMAAASSVTKELNVPQDVAIQGMTRLTAAVKGAGGGVADAELAFKNINSAIIATGGGAEQVEGAVTALVQIFSKGKVSAEEINQIAERLPGTFNKIAAASGRTGPELTKALQDGKVGLNDLMKFLVELGDDYGALAEKIAQSSESAGARLQVAYDKMRQEVGKALQPIGAEFQAAFAEFIQDITPGLVSAAKAVGDGLRFIIQNRKAITVAASFALKLAAVNLALKAFAAFNGPVSAMFTLLRTGFKATSQQAALAQTKLAALGGTVKALAVSLAAPIVITFAVVGAEMVIAYFNRIKKARADLDKTFEAPRGVDYFKAIGGKAATRQKLLKEIGNITKASNILRERIEKTKETLESLKLPPEVTFEGGGTGGIAAVNATRKTVLNAQLKADEAELQRLIDNFQELKRNLPKAKDERDALTQFQGPTIDTETGGVSRDAERKAEEIAQLQRQLAQSNARKEMLKIDQEISATRLAIVDAQDQQNFAGERALKGLLNTLEFEKQKLEINNDYNAAVREIRETTEGQAAELAEQIQTQDSLTKLEGLKLELKEKQINAQQDLNRLTKEQSKTFEEQFTDRQRQLGLISRDDFNKILLKREESRLRGKMLKPEQRERGLEQLRQEIDPTPFESMRQNITQLKDELRELVDPVNQITSAATAIGDAFSQSFVDAISGASTAKEALASFFKSVGSYFLDMAKQIIAKMIQIAILNSVAKLLPGSLGGFSLGGTPFGAGGGEVGGIGTLGPNFGIAQRAAGGSVSPGNTYMVGERGPELLTMTPSGGYVTSNSASQAAMDRYSGGNTRGGSISVNYNVTEINGMKFVTEDQFRAGISQAAKQGADGGFNRTMSSLKNSRSTRSRVGV